jgi:O-antigen ligase
MANSVILAKLSLLITKIYTLFINGFIGKLFTSYSSEEKLLNQSYLFSHLKNAKITDSVTGKMKIAMARAFENSLLLALAERLVSSLIYRKIKTYGAFFLSLGGYGMVTYLVRFFAFPSLEADLSSFLVSAVIMFVSLPLMASKATLAEAMIQSKLLSPILFDGLGLPGDSFTQTFVFPNRYTVVTFLGMSLGILTWFVNPIYYIVAIAAIIGMLVIFRHPEIGVVGWMVLLPLVGFFDHASIVLAGVVLTTDISYLIKLIRGKRPFHMHLIDYPILLFSIIYLVGGIITCGGMRSFHSALMYVIFLLAYFPVVNLIRTREWVWRCVKAGVLSGLIACLVGVLQIFTGTVNASWLNTDMFSGISTRIVSLFENPNVFAEYLLMLIPFALACFLRKGSVRDKLIFGFAMLLSLLCLVFTWSRGAWLGILIGLFLFFVIHSHKSWLVFLGIGVASPLLLQFVPSTVAERFASIGNLAETSISYRISAWYGVLELLEKTWWCGIGVGTAAFEAFYPSVALAGVEIIEHAHSLYLQLATELGIPGLLLFVIIIFLFAQYSFEYLLRVKSQEERVIVIAGIASTAAMLVMGATDHIFYSYRVFLAFWTTIALVCTSVKCGFYEQERSYHYENNTQYSSAIEISTESL